MSHHPTRCSGACPLDSTIYGLSNVLTSHTLLASMAQNSCGGFHSTVGRDLPHPKRLKLCSAYAAKSGGIRKLRKEQQ